MKKTILHILTVMLPYLFIGMCWCCSFGAFDYQEAIMSEPFLISSAVYWGALQWALHMAIQEEF